MSRTTVLAAVGWWFFGGGCDAVDDVACRGLCEELVERLALVGVERTEHLVLGCSRGGALLVSPNGRQQELDALGLDASRAPAGV